MNEHTPTDQTLENIKIDIEKMGKPQHIEILNILKRNYQVKINENRNGVYINLSFVPNSVIEELETYISYIKDQELSLNIMEIEKENCKTTFFSDTKNDTCIAGNFVPITTHK
jgi:hypothetical protein